MSEMVKKRFQDPDQCRKASIVAKKLWQNSEFVRKISEAAKNRKHSEETKQKISEIQKGKILSEEHCRKLSEAGRGRIFSKETKLKISIGNKGKVRSEEVRSKLSKINKGKVYSEETKQKMSRTRRELLKSSELRKKISEIQKKVMKKLWQNPEYALMMGKARSLRPNKPEKVILNLLNNLYPNEWKYTGDFSFIIDGKSPDFTNCNGQKKVIELFGDYWHKGENPEDRKNIFKEFGYSTLVIWEHELKNMKEVKNKIHEFCGEV